MSVRAHFVKHIDIGPEAFNLWHDEDLVEMLEEMGALNSLNDDLVGFMELSREMMKDLIELAEEQAEEENKEVPEWAENLKSLLKKYPDRDYFAFYCY